MIHHRKPARLIFRHPAYREAFENLDRALEENTPSDNAEKIRLLRLVMFHDVEALEQSGGLKLPK